MTRSPEPDHAPRPTADHLRFFRYALRTLLWALPALGRGERHADAPPGLSAKHFVVAGVIAAGVLVGTLIALARIVIALATG